MQMKRLEEEIGKPLFVRNRKMLALTGAGELLLLSGRIEPFDDSLPDDRKFRDYCMKNVL